MAVVRFDPLALLDDFDSLIRTTWGENAREMGQSLRWVPAVNMRANDTDVNIELELPGVRREDIDVEVLGKRLRVSGERRETFSSGDETGGTLVREMRYGSFSREFRLPTVVSGKQVSADYADGILRLHITGAKTLPPEPEKIVVGERQEAIEAVAKDASPEIETTGEETKED